MKFWKSQKLRCKVFLFLYLFKIMFISGLQCYPYIIKTNCNKITRRHILAAENNKFSQTRHEQSTFPQVLNFIINSNNEKLDMKLPTTSQNFFLFPPVFEGWILETLGQFIDKKNFFNIFETFFIFDSEGWTFSYLVSYFVECMC